MPVKVATITAIFKGSAKALDETSLSRNALYSWTGNAE